MYIVYIHTDKTVMHIKQVFFKLKLYVEIRLQKCDYCKFGDGLRKQKLCIHLSLSLLLCYFREKTVYRPNIKRTMLGEF